MFVYISTILGEGTMCALVNLKQHGRADGKPWASLPVLFPSPLVLEAWVSGVCSSSYSEHNWVLGLTHMILVFQRMRQEDGQEFKVILAIDRVPVQPGWQSETLAPPPPKKKKRNSLHAKFSMCIQSVHCDPGAFLPRWLHATHCLTLPTLEYELGSIPCRHKQICPIPFKTTWFLTIRCS